ncbi:MAG: uracil-DNA glycosylase [Deltaproteobacteria bacterium]|nr:uracil-DNA glycosylase [Deltaproteobacteria bacterium]
MNKKCGAKGTAETCPQCRHYYITWDSAHPYGCKAYGFKSLRSPHIVVEESSGEPCKLFAARRPRHLISER